MVAVGRERGVGGGVSDRVREGEWYACLCD
jgi:hypothetical protein